MVQSVDIVPTILDLLNIKENVDFDGRSLAPLMRGDIKDEEHKYVISEIQKNYFSIQNKLWEFVLNIRNNERVIRLYNLRKDSNEIENVASYFPEKVAEYESILRKHIKSSVISKKESREQEEVDENIRIQLKGLEYFD